MSRRNQTTRSIHTAEFAGEFEAHTLRLLKQRFVVFCTFGAVFGLLITGIGLTVNLFSTFSNADTAGVLSRLWGAIDNTLKVLGTSFVPMCIFIAALLWVQRGKVREQSLFRLSQIVVVSVGGFYFVAAAVGWIPNIGWLVAASTLLIASILLPWDAKAAFFAGLALLVVNSFLLFLNGKSFASVIAYAILIGAMFTPSILIAWLKHSRYLEQFRFAVLQQRYGEVRRELTDARKIHESLFPARIDVGPLRLGYQYEPMRQIGGDYLYAYVGPGVTGGQRLSVILMDVTGHGIPAALTVNRLHGELERVFAEDPTIEPGRVLSLLNRYVHLTLASHSVFVTALCLRIDSGTGVLEFASGGHPPAFLIGVDGTVRELNSTAMVLGACEAGEFDSAQFSTHFGAGDTLLAYTDGALEARDRTGKMLGVQGILRLVASMAGAPRDENRAWSRDLLAAVERHRYGPPADDTLVVEIARTMQPHGSESAGVRFGSLVDGRGVASS